MQNECFKIFFRQSSDILLKKKYEPKYSLKKFQKLKKILWILSKPFSLYLFARDKNQSFLGLCFRYGLPAIFLILCEEKSTEKDPGIEKKKCQ